MASGYEDQNDPNTLRVDPLLKMVCGSLPERAVLSWLPNPRDESARERRRCSGGCYRVAQALLELYLRRRGGDPKKVLLGFGSTDDPTHGEQEGSHCRGYHGHHMYHPLVVFDGETGRLITAILRERATPTLAVGRWRS